MSARSSGSSLSPRPGGRPIACGSISGPEIGLRKSSAQLVASYAPEALLGRQVAAVVNFPPKQIARFMSEVLVLGFPDAAGETILVGPERPVPNGGRLY